MYERTWINQPRSIFSVGFTQAIATTDNELFIFEGFSSEFLAAIVAYICLISGKRTVKHQSF